MRYFDIPAFIARHIIKREKSLFNTDIEAKRDELTTQIRNKSVLIIGGAGTIGSSFIKAILAFHPSSLTVVDINENGLTELTRDLRSDAHIVVPKKYKTYPINFGDPIFEELVSREGPFNIVAHFAAHKHVRSEKDQYAIYAMLENNVFRTKNLLDLMLNHKPEHFFCVSTDKASNPVNVMGASKKLMEAVIMAYKDHLKVTTARFANVAFSNGSLLDGYMYRMIKNQPLSCPSDIKRYFVSPQESGHICMLACILGESGDIFFPNLPKNSMMLFKEITQQFIKENGLIPKICKSEEEAINFADQRNINNPAYPVYYFQSKTSGEKHFEEFYSNKDIVDRSLFHSLGIIRNSDRNKLDEINRILIELSGLKQKKNFTKAYIIELLSQYIPDFEHRETGHNLDEGI